MSELKAKHAVGDPIHVKLLFGDDRLSMRFYGGITASRLHARTSIFPDQIHYDGYLEQTDAPHIYFQNLPEGFVLAGGRDVEEEEPA